jgi:hypothetical protein
VLPTSADPATQHPAFTGDTPGSNHSEAEEEEQDEADEVFITST